MSKFPFAGCNILNSPTLKEILQLKNLKKVHMYVTDFIKVCELLNLLNLFEGKCSNFYGLLLFSCTIVTITLLQINKINKNLLLFLIWHFGLFLGF